MLMPAVTRSREVTRRVLCSNNLKSLGLASMMYSNDNANNAIDASGYPVKAPGADWNTYGRYCFDPVQRQRLYNDYGMHDYKAWWCPSGLAEPYGLLKTFYNPRFIGFDPTYQAWPVNDNHWALTPYAYFAGPGRKVRYKIAGAQIPMLKYDTVDQPALRMVWIDPLNAPDTTFMGASATLYMPANTHQKNGSGGPEGGNYIMADGHLEWRGYRYADNIIDYGPSANWTKWIEQYYAVVP
jgi:hypothetical protein